MYEGPGYLDGESDGWKAGRDAYITHSGAPNAYCSGYEDEYMVLDDGYAAGYADGYKEGWKYAEAGEPTCAL